MWSSSFTATLVAVAFLVVVAGSVAAGNLKAYEGASWYEKYLSVTGPEPLPCPRNSGEAPQLSFPGNPLNVDASHECGSQSETFIAINPANPSKVVTGSNEIQRLPMRANSSFDGGATFTGHGSAVAGAADAQRLRLRLRPGLCVRRQRAPFYSYIIVFFSKGGSINGTEMAVLALADAAPTWTPTFFTPQTGNGQFNDKPMITVDTGTGADHHHNRIYVAWDNATGLVVREEREQRRPVPLRRPRRDLLRTRVGERPLQRQDRRNRCRPLRRGGRHGARRVAGLRAQPDLRRLVDRRRADFLGSRTRSRASAGFEFDPVAQGTRGALVYPACAGSFAATHLLLVHGRHRPAGPRCSLRRRRTAESPGPRDPDAGGRRRVQPAAGR